MADENPFDYLKLVKESLQPAPDPVSTGAGQPLLSRDDLQLVEQIKQSRTWKLLVQGMEGAREMLLLSRPKSSEELWAVWGRVAQLGDLLQGGPLVVLEYSKMAARQRDESASPASQDLTISDVQVHTVR